MEIVTALAVGALFGIGVFQILRRNIIRSVIGLIIMSSAINLFLLSIGAFSGQAPAYANAVGTRADALPQALILTAIVITFAVSAFLMALIYRSWRLGTQDRVEDDRADVAMRSDVPMRGEETDAVATDSEFEEERP